jgi:hypothetical protein
VKGFERRVGRGLEIGLKREKVGKKIRDSVIGRG